jgi:hypothetical protein
MPGIRGELLIHFPIAPTSLKTTGVTEEVYERLTTDRERRESGKHWLQNENRSTL